MLIDPYAHQNLRPDRVKHFAPRRQVECPELLPADGMDRDNRAPKPSNPYPTLTVFHRKSNFSRFRRVQPVHDLTRTPARQGSSSGNGPIREKEASALRGLRAPRRRRDLPPCAGYIDGMPVSCIEYGHSPRPDADELGLPTPSRDCEGIDPRGEPPGAIKKAHHGGTSRCDHDPPRGEQSRVHHGQERIRDGGRILRQRPLSRHRSDPCRAADQDDRSQAVEAYLTLLMGSHLQPAPLTVKEES